MSRIASFAPRLKIAHKLPAIIIGSALVAALAVGGANYITGRAHILAMDKTSLSGILAARMATFSRQLDVIEQDLALQAADPNVLHGLQSLEYGWHQFGNNPGPTLQKLYITDNPNPAGKKDAMLRAGDESDYTIAHAGIHPHFRALVKTRGYGDVFLIDPTGNVVYTTYKEPDYATNLLTGRWKNSGISKTFKALRADPRPGRIAYTDFESYAPSGGVPASFIAAPILDKAGKFVGALAFQMPINAINATMQDKSGLGATGQTYIVGRDLLMRSDSRFLKEPTILRRKVDNAAVRDALEGRGGVTNITDYRGRDALVAYAPFDFHGVRWAFVAEKEMAEVMKPVVEMRNDAVVGTGIVIAVLALLGLLFARSLVRPIAAMTAAMGRLAGGDKETEIPARDRRDEIGQMAAAVQVFKDGMIENERLLAERQTAERHAQEEKHRRDEETREAEARAAEERRLAEGRAQAERRKAMLELADSFESSVGAVIELVTSSAAQMESAAQSMTSTAEETNRQSAAVAAAAEQATANVQAVASAAEELASTVREVGRQVEQSTSISGTAVEEAKKTNARVQGLAEAAQKIGDVVNLINDIAAQTNLLALNATIEAARAGEAGKGFAVVASEVKSLANQTAKATEEIGTQIGAIQGSTDEAVQAIQGIGSTIAQVNEIASAIAASIEEQSAATSEIAGNASQAAAGTQEVSGNISGVNRAATETGSAATQVLSSARALKDQATVLKSSVEQFLERVRAA